MLEAFAPMVKAAGEGCRAKEKRRALLAPGVEVLREGKV